MKTHCNKNKRKPTKLAKLYAALFVACFCGLCVTTCEAQIPDWPTDYPLRRLAKEDMEQTELDRKVAKEKAFQEKVRNDLVHKVQDFQKEIHQAMEEIRQAMERRRQYEEMLRSCGAPYWTLYD